ncbi:MAG: CPBP family intramembrane metalloprotease [Clostridia bacterium]|nr:CPBP family intramembrane metalloprotease [Clostridia bacterium]
MGEKVGEFFKQAALALLYILIYDGVTAFLTYEALALGLDAMAATGVIMLIAAVATFLLYKVSFYVRGIEQHEYCMGVPKFWDILFAFSLAIGFRFITSAYFVWADNVTILSQSMESAANYDVGEMTSLGLFSMILVTIIVGPIFEEILFRGIVMTRLKSVMPAWLAILIQGIIFGASHMVLIQGIFTAVLGIIMGYIYHKTGKLSVSVAIHIVFNLSAVIGIKDENSAVICGAAGAVVVILSIAMFIILYGKKKKTSIMETKEE